VYPGDLVKLCIRAWRRVQKDRGAPPNYGELRSDLPAEPHLKHLLETIYHVSLMAEEGRRLSIRVMFLCPGDFQRTEEAHGVRHELARLQSPRDLSTSELLKLAPAVRATESAILVSRRPEVEPTAHDSLCIWAIVHFGTQWAGYLAGIEEAASIPPSCLTISSFSPGALTVSTVGRVLLRLRGGKLLRTPLPYFEEGHVGAFLESSARRLYEDIVEGLGRKRYSRYVDSDRYPQLLYFGTITRILNLIREQRHGGTLLIVAHQDDTGKGIDRAGLSIKYRLDGPTVWRSLVDQGVASANYFRIRIPDERVMNRFIDTSVVRLNEMIEWDSRARGARAAAENFCRFVASLTAVDGAVLMTSRLRVLGFGAEITGVSPDAFTLKEALTPDALEVRDISSERFGTRHRSAMRFCSKVEDCLALVVSQDGPARAIKRVGEHVMLWNDVTLSDLAV
jgi:hypothetical protein